MKRLLSVITLGLLVAVPSFASRRVLPLVGHAPGAQGTFWTSDLQISSKSALAQHITLRFHPNGQPEVDRSIDLLGNESVLLEDVVHPEHFGRTDDTTWIGELEIESIDDFSATARTFTHDSNRNDDNGTFGSVDDSMDPSLLPTGGTVTGIRVDDSFRSNIALTNATDHSVTVHFDIRRRDGSVAAHDDVPVGAHQTAQISAGRYLQPGDDKAFSMNWSSDDKAFVVVSTVDQKSGDPTNYSSVGAPSSTLFFPLIGKTPGANGTFWTTELNATNSEDRSGQVEVEYQGDDGVHKTASFSIPARGSFHSDDIFQELGVPSGSGFMNITSTVALNASARVFNTREDGSTFGSNVEPQQRASKSSLVQIPGVRRDDNFRLNVAIADDNGVDATGTIRFFDDKHNEIEDQQFSVPAHSSRQFSVTKTSIHVGSGEIEVETEHGVQVTAIASNIDNHSGDTVMHESEQENERQQELEIRMSTKSAAPGTPITFTAVTPAGSQISSISWDFGDGSSATGAQVSHAYTAGGEFKVTMLVTLASGATLRKAEDVEITGNPQQGGGASSFDFSWTPSAPQPGQSVTFKAIIGGSAPAGAVIKWTIEGVKTTGATVTHTFAAAGSYEVEAELEQEGGAGTLQATHEVQVGGGTQPPGNGATAIDFSWSPSSPKAGDSVSFNASVTGTPVAGSSIKWRMPDGSRPTGANVSFTFATAGSFSVEVEMEQPGKSNIQRQRTVTVAAK